MDTDQLSENSSAVGSSKSGMSTSTAKFFELEKAFKRQQADNEARDKNSSDRMQQLERQRFSRFEGKEKNWTLYSNQCQVNSPRFKNVFFTLYLQLHLPKIQR